MEFIKYTSQFEKMIDNKIIGNLSLVNSEINFFGKNNILYCDNNIELNDSILNFYGDNSIVYLSSNISNLFNLSVFNNSSVFIGKNSKFDVNFSLLIYENQNLIIGDDCIVGKNVTISTSDGFPIYYSDSKKRINFSKSVYIGDHVLVGHNCFISKGVRIGSGTIIDNASFLQSYAKIPSNTYLSGNPAKIIHKKVFFVDDFVGSFKWDESANSEFYKSNVFIFDVIGKETLSLTNIDNILNDLDVESRLEFIQKLLVQNKRKNRFSI